jgi:hypothetical protein
MVRVLASTQTKDYKIGMCCFSSNQVALRHRLAGSESKLCIQVDRHVYPRTVVSVSVTRSLVFCVMFGLPFCPFILAIVLSVLLRLPASTYPLIASNSHNKNCL